MPSGTAAPERRRGCERAEPGWRVAALLALPYLLVVAGLQGLTEALPTFHSGDETTYHLPTIELFAGQLPGVDLVHYPAAQTPLFHLLVAGWGELAGMELWRLRIVEVAISYALLLVLYGTLRRHRGFGAWPAAALALLFGCSPYVFGQSFILVTDNLGLLFCVLALERLLAWRERRAWSVFAAACAWIALTLLTRQSYVWLPLLACVVVLVDVWPGVRAAGAGAPARLAAAARATAPAAGLLALAVAPLAALVLAWDGLVPPTADPASCGLCDPDEGRLGWDGGTPLRAPLLTVGLVGLYGTLLLGRSFWPELRAWRARGGGAAGWRAPLLGAAAGVVLLLIVRLAWRPVSGDEGFLWRIARSGPAPLGSSWLFWVLVPLGCALLVLWARRDGWRSLPLLLLGCFVLAQLATRLAYQKYFDPFVLLALLLALRPQWLRTRADWIGPALVAALSLAYFFAFVVGLIDPTT